MKIHWSDSITNYDGTQLKPHWILDTYGFYGNALCAFQGSCEVKTENMLDLLDAKQQLWIRSGKMLHFIGEFFGPTLKETVLLQRLLVSLVQQEIILRTGSKIIRSGNDLYEDSRKLSVSIATCSMTSTLIHYGINISSKETPVVTKGLEDYKIDPKLFAQSILQAFEKEFVSLDKDISKVKAAYP